MLHLYSQIYMWTCPYISSLSSTSFILSFPGCSPRHSHLRWLGTSHEKGATWKLSPCYAVEDLRYMTGGPENSWVCHLHHWSDHLQWLWTYVNSLVITMSMAVNSSTQHSILSTTIVKDGGKKWFLFQRAVLNKWGEVTEFSFWGALYAAPDISTQVEGPPLQSAPCLSPPLANSPLGEWEGLPDGTHPLPLLSGGGFWKDSCALVCSHAMRALCSQDSATVGGGYCLDLPTTQ